MLGSEPLDDRPDRGVRLLELVEEVRVFGVMVRVDEAAVAQAADLELPERGVVSQRLELLVDPVDGHAVDDSCREASNAGELAADARMDGEQHLIQHPPAGSLWSLLEGGHGAHASRSGERAGTGARTSVA